MNRLKEIRSKLRISQLELTVKAHVSPTMIVAIEKYGYIPGSDVREKLAMVLGVPEEQIFPRDGSK